MGHPELLRHRKVDCPFSQLYFFDNFTILCKSKTGFKVVQFSFQSMLTFAVLAFFDDNNVLDSKSSACFVTLYAVITTFAGAEKDHFSE